MSTDEIAEGGEGRAEVEPCSEIVDAFCPFSSCARIGAPEDVFGGFVAAAEGAIRINLHLPFN